MPDIVKVAKVGVKKKDGFLYFVDKDGDISMVKMSRGKKSKKKAVNKNSTKKKPAKKSTKKPVKKSTKKPVKKAKK